MTEYLVKISMRYKILKTIYCDSFLTSIQMQMKMVLRNLCARAHVSKVKLICFNNAQIRQISNGSSSVEDVCEVCPRLYFF